MEPVQITDNIYLGGLKSTECDLENHGITHALIAVTSPPPQLHTPKPLTIKFLDIDDTPEQDIAQFFEESNQFISECISNPSNKILIACNSGVSRSATLLIAYLMKTEKFPPINAADIVRQRKPDIGPNPGFQDQLTVYYQSGFEINENSKYHREWKLKQLNSVNNNSSCNANEPVYTKLEMPPLKVTWRHIIAPLLKAAGVDTNPSEIIKIKVADQLFSVTESISPTLQTSDVTSIDALSTTAKYTIETKVLEQILQKIATNSSIYRCKKCANKLASSHSLVRHEPLVLKTHLSPCQHFFIEPVEWMRPELEKSELEGRLCCFKCNHKIGSYHWQGSKCSCGAWITPCFKLNKSKVDEMVSKISLR